MALRSHEYVPRFALSSDGGSSQPEFTLRPDGSWFPLVDAGERVEGRYSAKLSIYTGVDAALMPSTDAPSARRMKVYSGWSTLLVTSSRIVGIGVSGRTADAVVDYRNRRLFYWDLSLADATAPRSTDVGGRRGVLIPTREGRVGEILLSDLKMFRGGTQQEASVDDFITFVGRRLTPRPPPVSNGAAGPATSLHGLPPSPVRYGLPPPPPAGSRLQLVCGVCAARYPSVPDHPRFCTTCGATLQFRPAGVAPGLPLGLSREPTEAVLATPPNAGLPMPPPTPSPPAMLLGPAVFTAKVEALRQSEAYGKAKEFLATDVEPGPRGLHKDFALFAPITWLTLFLTRRGRKILLLVAVVIVGLVVLSGPIIDAVKGPSTQGQVCSAYDRLRNEVSGANGFFDNSIFNSAGDLGDVASRYEDSAPVRASGASLKRIASSDSTTLGALDSASRNIASLCGRPPMSVSGFFD